MVAGSRRSVVHEQDFENSLRGSAAERPRRLPEREYIRQEAVNGNLSLTEEAESRSEPSAARADECDLIHNDRRRVERDGAMNGGFHNERAARLRHRDGGAEAARRPGRVDHKRIGGLGESAGRDTGLDAGIRRDAQFFRVAAIEMDHRGAGVQHMSDEETEFAIAEHGHLGAARNANLVEDFAGGRERFHENGLFGGELLRQYVEIPLGQGEKLSEGARMIDDAKDRSVRTVPAELARAPFAFAAVEVDLAHHAAAEQTGIGSRHDLPGKLVAGAAGEAVIAAEKFEVGIADAGRKQPDQRVPFRRARHGRVDYGDLAAFEMDGKHERKYAPTIITKMGIHMTSGAGPRPAAASRAAPPPSSARLVCFAPECRQRFPVREVIYNCPVCGGLLEVMYDFPKTEAAHWKKTWRERRMSNAPSDQSGVWRYREIVPFLPEDAAKITLREGNTPLLPAPSAARYARLRGELHFKHQGFNPTGSFKDNGMTCGASQAVHLGMRRVACVSTGNTSASMAAYAAAAGLQPVIFLPHGNISFGKLAQALEYGAKTLLVDANFDQILKLVRVLAERLGIYLLNSINPFRIEGQKTIMVEMLDQRDWDVPDWVVVPGGNLGNVSAFCKGLRELKELGFIGRLPRLAVIQAEGAAPFFEFYQRGGEFRAVEQPETLATAIRIGDPVSWPKAYHEVSTSGGTVDKVSEQEIADAKAQIGLAGIGCEPASAATLAGLRKLVAAGVIATEAKVVAVLTGNLLKDSDYIYRYHTGKLETPGGAAVAPNYGNEPIVAPNDPERIASILEGN
jgi:threonine synthase